MRTKKLNVAFLLILASGFFVSCELKEDPVPEAQTDIREVYASYKACTTDNYKLNQEVTFKRENGKKETYTVTDRYYESEYEYQEADVYTEIEFESEHVYLYVNLRGTLKKDGSIVELGDVTIMPEDPNEYTGLLLGEVVHSGDKIYIKDPDTQKYVCILQKGRGILHIEDNYGNTWDNK